MKSESGRRALQKDIEAMLPCFRGEIEQIPPMFSAVQKNGQRLYDLARKGIEVEREPRRVTVYSLELCSFDEDSQCGTLSVKCSKGTYIRTIIDDIGAALGTGAVMTALRRTFACGYTLDDCVTLDELKELCDSGKINDKLRPVECLFSDYGALSVSEAQAKRFKNGGALDILRTALRDKKTPDGTTLRIKTREGEFLGLGIVSGGLIKIKKLFATA